MNNLGYIQLHRRILNWEWYSHIPVKTLFIHLLIKANYQDKRWRGIIVPRGSVVTSRAKLAKETGLTERQIRSALASLQKSNEVSSETTNNYSIISIINYDMYQAERQRDVTPDVTPSVQQTTTTKKDNNIINNNNPPIVPPRGDKSKKGETIENYFQGIFPDGDVSCPEDWGVMAYEIFHELRPSTNLDLVKEINWEFDNFYSYWKSLGSVARAKKKDWKSTWRVWWKRRAEQLNEKEKKDEFFKRKYS